MLVWLGGSLLVCLSVSERLALSVVSMCSMTL